MIERVGFIGLGFIGEPMARQLCEPFELCVFDLRPETVQLLVEAGAKPAASAREVAERSQVVGVCVLDDAGVESVVAGEDGILAGAAPGTVVAVHSTLHPDTVKRLAERARESQVSIIDAQMTGGPAGAAAGTLRFMLGGEEAAVELARPYLQAMGSEITHCGAHGSGAVAKLCNNLVQYGLWQTFVDAQRLAEGTGLELEKLHEVLGWIMNDNARAMLAGRAALERDPENEFLLGRFSETLLLAEKDLSLALDVARRAGVSMPQTALCNQLLARLFAVPDPKRR